MRTRPGIRPTAKSASLLLAQWLLYAFVFWLPILIWIAFGG
jgi:hypothetical protein